MKIKDGYILREVAGSYVVLPLGEATLDFNGMATLNEVGAYIFGKMQQEVTRQEILEAMLERYDIDKETAEQDLDIFIEKIRGAGIIE